LRRGPLYDLAIINATVHDGTGAKPFTGGVGIVGKHIAVVWRTHLRTPPQATILLDAAGADLTPGFIDTHSNAEMSILATHGPIRADNLVSQGITTVVGGNCGRSPVDIASFASDFQKRGANINIAVLVGYNAVRRKVMGQSSAKAMPDQTQAICALIESAMRDGALGMSTGYAYAPGRFASREELLAALQVVAKYGGIHATHLRDEGTAEVSAMQEAMDVSKSAGVPLLLSHLKVTGLKNCGLFDQMLSLMELAGEGSRPIQVFCDFYPYDASSTGMDIYLPDWFLALSHSERSIVLRTQDQRARLRHDLMDRVLAEGFTDLSFAAPSEYSPRHDWQGKTLAEIDRSMHGTTSLESQADLYLTMVAHGGAQMVFHNMCKDVVDRIPSDLAAMVGTDSAIRSDSEEGRPHPRGWGTFPRYLAVYVRERKALSLDEAVRRITWMPAQVFKIARRGKIAAGYYADLVVFDSSQIRDNATYDNPFQRPKGINYVVVNGRLVVEAAVTTRSDSRSLDSRLTPAMPGKYVRRNDTLPRPTLDSVGHVPSQ
jgi:N-acyl-D-aspartate/D-glutamate deacylase